MKTLESGELRYGVSKGVATIEVNRPEKLNPLNIPLVRDMHVLLDEIHGDREVRVVVFKGAPGEGAVFAGSMAGADVPEMAACETGEEFAAYYGTFVDFYKRMRSLSQPIISVFNGYAFGGACALAQSSEFVLASDTTTFGMLEINYGFPGGAATFAGQFGRQRAAELTMLGRQLSAEEAQRMMLVYKVLPQERLEEETGAICAKLIRQSFQALELGKRTYTVAAEHGMAAAVDFEWQAASACMNSEYSRAKVRRFMEKNS